MYSRVHFKIYIMKYYSLVNCSYVIYLYMTYKRTSQRTDSLDEISIC